MNSLQLLVHTELNWNPKGRLQFLNLIFNTPSHHCVHHGSQDQYLDKNFGAVFIIWDRLFGTFVPQGEKVVYGARRALLTLNPIRALFDEYRYLYQAGRILNSPVAVWFWSPAKTAEKLGQVGQLPEHEPSRVSASWQPGRRETWLSLLVTFASFFVLLYQETKPSEFLLFIWATHIVFGIFIAGEWLDYSVRARSLERWRSAMLLVTSGSLYLSAPSANRWPVLLILLAASVCAYISLPRSRQDFETVSVT